MYIITYGKKNLTFKADTLNDAERLLRRCEVDQGQLTPDRPEDPPKVMPAEVYLAAKHLGRLDDIVFDDPAYL
jgi:hypothetical protein